VAKAVLATKQEAARQIAFRSLAILGALVWCNYIMLFLVTGACWVCAAFNGALATCLFMHCTLSYFVKVLWTKCRNLDKPMNYALTSEMSSQKRESVTGLCQSGRWIGQSDQTVEPRARQQRPFTSSCLNCFELGNT
jgi:hypothetical protein